jgi:hypothetical protein
MGGGGGIGEALGRCAVARHRPQPHEMPRAQAVEVALGVERRHAAGAGAGHGLAVDVVLHVAGGEYAGTLVAVALPLRPPWVTM